VNEQSGSQSQTGLDRKGFFVRASIAIGNPGALSMGCRENERDGDQSKRKGEAVHNNFCSDAPPQAECFRF
jgi:hypothetical protein